MPIIDPADVKARVAALDISERPTIGLRIGIEPNVISVIDRVATELRIELPILIFIRMTDVESGVEEWFANVNHGDMLSENPYLYAVSGCQWPSYVSLNGWTAEQTQSSLDDTVIILEKGELKFKKLRTGTSPK